MGEYSGPGYDSFEIYGCVDDENPRRIIAEIFRRISEEDVDVLMRKRIIFITPEGNSTMQIARGMGIESSVDIDDRIFIVTVSKRSSNEVGFAQTVAHELAHVIFEDHQHVALPNDISSANAELFLAVRELRADLKTDEWGFLKIKEDSYLYGSGWEEFSHINKTVALEYARLGDNEKIFKKFQVEKDD